MSQTHLIIGAGKMGGALIRGWLDAGLVPAKKLAILDPRLSSDAVYAVEKGAVHLDGTDDIPSSVKVVLLAIKPQMVADIAKACAESIPPEALLISVLAGTSVVELEGLFGARPIVRAMPNTPAAIGAGITAVFPAAGTDERQLEIAETLLAASGSVHRVEAETMINAVTAISGSGPAYIFHMCEALEAAGQALGLSEKLAPEFARQTIIGAAALLKESELSPAQLRKNVTSPNGTTQAALEVLMEPSGLGPLMLKACRAAYARAKELSKG